MLPTTASARATPSAQDSSDAVIEAERYALQHSLSYLLCTLHRDLMASTERRTREAGISAAQWRFLRTLYVEDGLTQRELSRRVGVREPTTLRAMARLEQLGLIERRAVAEDRRKIQLVLTALGRAQVSRLLPMVTEVNQVALDGRTESEERELKRLLLGTIRNLQADLAR
jgi:DNA-binding MarR family transcriptional regulator